MHEFWATATYEKHHIKFKMNKKSYSFDLETFRDMFQVCPKIPGQKFVDPLFEEEILAFLSNLGYPGAHEGTGISPWVPDVPTYGSDDERISWKYSDEENDDDETNVSKVKEDDDQEDDDDQ
nr:hypothetical protein [Tanacetum cinerariifolium]